MSADEVDEAPVRGSKLRSRSHNYKNFLAATPFLLFIVFICVAMVSFFAGVSYQKGHTQLATSSTNSGGSSQFQPQAGGRGFGGGRSASNRVVGPVTAISSSSITIQNRRTGSNVTLAITSSTQISNGSQSGSASDIQVGDMVFVTEDSSNTSQAATILDNTNFGGSGGQQQSNPNAVTN